LSNTVNLPIAPAGQATCIDSTLTQAQLTRLDSGGDIVGGHFGLLKTASTQVSIVDGQTRSQGSLLESVNGSIARYNAAEYTGRFGQRSIPPCTIFESTGALNSGFPHSYLNAGPKLTMAGPGLPGGASLAAFQSGLFFPLYSLTLLPGTLTTGTYTIAGNGGSDIGPFNASLTLPDSFTVDNWDSISSISRSQPFTVHWSGGGTELVSIQLYSSATNTATGVTHLVNIICNVPASTGTFTVPVSTLSLLPAASLGFTPGSLASISVSVTPTSPVRFTANLISDGQIDYGNLTYSVGVSRNVGFN
jgi:hypothetical protein